MGLGLRLWSAWGLVGELRRMPRVSIDLMCAEAAGNDPFFETIVRRHYRDARRFHRRYLLWRNFVNGVAVTALPDSFDAYFDGIKGSARRNFRKATREGCHVRRIDFNEHLDEVAAIRASTRVRQNRPMPPSFLEGAVSPVKDPPSRNSLHDYPYFGAFLKGELIGYCGAMIAGEYAGIEQIFGHSAHASTCAVPLLIVDVARHLFDHHPRVRYYAYGTYFGASETMKRFKRKFNFHPHHVDWRLGDEALRHESQTAMRPVNGARLDDALQERDCDFGTVVHEQ